MADSDDPRLTPAALSFADETDIAFIQRVSDSSARHKPHADIESIFWDRLWWVWSRGYFCFYPHLPELWEIHATMLPKVRAPSAAQMWPAMRDILRGMGVQAVFCQDATRAGRLAMRAIGAKPFVEPGVAPTLALRV